MTRFVASMCIALTTSLRPAMCGPDKDPQASLAQMEERMITQTLASFEERDLCPATGEESVAKRVHNAVQSPGTGQPCPVPVLVGAVVSNHREYPFPA